jgi:ABC-type antimicrobial peptide transport system permease subunit
VVRTKRAATDSFLTEARQAIWSVNSNLPVFAIRTLQDLYDQSMARTSFTLVLLAIAGAMALVLGIVGIYGVIAYAVTQRTREIGIRMALGAQRRGILRLILGEVAVVVAIGVVIGTGLTLAGSKAASSMLFQLKPRDPLTLAMAVMILTAIGLLASLVPARRASRLDPMAALRNE